MNDFISREDTIDKMQEVDWYHQNKNGEMVHGANSSEHQAWYKAEDVYKVLEDMPPADVQLDTKELVAKIKKGISATNADDVYSCGMRDGMRWCMSLVDDEEPLFENCPSAQPERDIPVKPIETTDKAWGIPKRQAVCPKCDYYLGHVAFLGDYKGKRITYCETCGQAIDWEGWEFDE